MIPRLALTPGEPAGIGPDLAVTCVQSDHFKLAQPAELVAFASPELLQQRAEQLKLPLKLREVDLSAPPQPSVPGELGVVPIPMAKAAHCGQLDSANAPYVLDTLDQAIDACLQGKAQALVTGPVQKSVINDAGIPFSGHTEFLATKAQRQRVVMLLATSGLRVALATTHLPLSAVSAAITAELLIEVTTILNNDLQTQFGIARPRILVCGLNPHAGEGGHLGREEIEVIEPTLAQLRSQGIDCVGPLPADTLFTPKYLEQADAVLAMYHDQGLPVLKYQGFGEAVNITLGLPFIRTSVDHGTALDLAGSGNIDCGSLQTAISYAGDMIRAQSR